MDRRAFGWPWIRGSVGLSARFGHGKRGRRSVSTSSPSAPRSWRPVCPSHQEPHLPVCREIQMSSGMPCPLIAGQERRGGPWSGPSQRCDDPFFDV